jgi:Zn-dependent protease
MLVEQSTNTGWSFKHIASGASTARRHEVYDVDVSPTLRLGRVFGIQIGLNWSLLFVFALIAWSLATQLPPQVPGRLPAEYWIAGIAGALAFYVCLLAHELAHSVVARMQGVKVSGITLWLFGGVSNLETEPKSARSEALITFVGPLTSLVVAAIAYVLAVALAASHALALVVAVLIWLAYINVALGVFNLLPAFPLDGGRLLSSILWWRSGSRRQGIHQAVQVGRVIAYLMIAIGLLQLFFVSVVGGIWLAFLGWFLLSAAGAEEAGVAARELLRKVAVSAAMTSPVVTVPDWLTVEQFLSAEAPRHSFTTYPVHDPQGALTGVVRLREVIEHRRPGQLDKRVSEFAHPLSEIVTARPDEDLGALVERAGARLERRVLVFDGTQLVGIISPADIARILTLRQAMAKQRPAPTAAAGGG